MTADADEKPKSAAYLAMKAQFDAADERGKKILIARALVAKKNHVERAKHAGPGGLLHFVRYFWNILEPMTPLVEGWPMEAMCSHLEAVTDGKINRLLIVVPPGFCKSLLTNVFWPAWEWSARDEAHHRYVAFSYAASLTERDNRRFLRVITSKQFEDLYGTRFKLAKAGETLIANDKTGWKLASSFGGVGTGERGSRVLCDDLHNVREAESDTVRTNTVTWFKEAVQNRLNDLSKSAIIVDMQRVHEADVAGVIKKDFKEYTVLEIPMLYDGRDLVHGKKQKTVIGWSDPRTEEGELAWPERYPLHTLRPFMSQPYMWSSQYQQTPEPRGGAIIKRDYWKKWESDRYPPNIEYIVASADTAYTAKESNDPSALTVWGLFTIESQPHLFLMHAWRKHLEIHGPDTERKPGEAESKWIDRTQSRWGLCEWIAYTCNRFKVHKLIIEGKASGLSVAQELRRLYRGQKWSLETVTPEGDKVARAHASIATFADGLIYAPNKVYSRLVQDECVAMGTKIITKEGVKNVEDVRVGDLVLTHKGRFRPVLATSKRVADHVVTIHGKSLDPLTLTPEHPLYAMKLTWERRIKSVDWVNAGDALPRRYIWRVRGKKTYKEPAPGKCHAVTLPIMMRESPIDEIDLGHWASTTNDERIYLVSNNGIIGTNSTRTQPVVRKQILDYRFGRVMGLYLAEGWARRGLTTWSFSAKEVDRVNEVTSFVTDRLGANTWARTQNNGTTVCAGLAIINDFFKEWGTSAFTKTVPNWVWNAPDEFLRGIFDGYFDGDGHDPRTGMIVATTVSPSLAWTIRLISIRIGKFATVRVTREAATMVINGRMYPTKLTYAVSYRTSRENRGATLPSDTVVGHSIMRVDSYDGPTKVFNMHVLEDESYCTTGGIVHNCAMFPKGEFKDLTDTVTQAIKHFRDNGLLLRRTEKARYDEEERHTNHHPEPLYPV